MDRADSFHPRPHENPTMDFQPDIHARVWKDAREMRRQGALLALGRKIQCPVVAIHGDYDPHSAEGVRRPLSGVLKDFRFFPLKSCGHTPWHETEARDRFFQILEAET